MPCSWSLLGAQHVPGEVLREVVCLELDAFRCAEADSRRGLNPSGRRPCAGWSTPLKPASQVQIILLVQRSPVQSLALVSLAWG